jgi:hypothetical protein
LKGIGNVFSGKNPRRNLNLGEMTQVQKASATPREKMLG